MIPDEVNFCPRCGADVAEAFRFGRLRKTCPACGWIHFADPKVAVAVLVEKDDHVLLVRRAIDPQRGLWTLPAGFVDAGEDPVHAAERECLEETGLVVRVSGLIDVIYGQEHSRGANILIAYRAEILFGGEYGDQHAELRPGDDVDRVGFFPRSNLPPLAFMTAERLLS